MIISTSPANPSKTKLDALIVVTTVFELKSSPWRKLNSSLSQLCEKANPFHDFSGKENSVLVLPTLGQITPPLLALVGIGKSSDPASHQRSLAKAIRQLQKSSRRGIQSLGIAFAGKPLSADAIAHAVDEATYQFRKFSPASDEVRRPLSKIILFSQTPSRDSLARASHVARAVRYARDLANQPPNYFTPAVLAREAQRLAKQRRLQLQVWDERRLKRDGFGGILAVGQGSANPPRFVRLDHRGGRPGQAPLVVIGKAITFDTGGISIKPSDRMDEMKFDKCGGIAVLGIMDAVAALRLPINVTGLIASAENMPGGRAYRPGDLIPTLSGKFVEVLNTDAEGRIVLADALTYAQRLKPRAMVDMATLTGACIVCFGHECAALLSNNDSLTEGLRAASTRTGEKVWPLPLWTEYQEKVKSDVAFVKNTAGREGGTITAACFLNAFVDAKFPWAHLDIAGMAWTSKEEPHRAKGATAFGVRLVTDWLANQ